MCRHRFESIVNLFAIQEEPKIGTNCLNKTKPRMP